MPLEIERRFLIVNDVSEMLNDLVDQENIEQSYLVDTGGWVQRIRLVEDMYRPRFFMTMKRPAGGFSNHEIEFEITEKTFRELEAHTGPTLIKQRHRIQQRDLVLEIDVFRNFKLIGLVIAEVELPSEQHPFTIPDWFGPEITGQREYSNVALARRLSDNMALPYFPEPA